jgi:glucose-6-phosphate 1-dehydrogenase
MTEYTATSIGRTFRVESPFVFTIFGASGDLAKLKIFPALFALAEQKRLPAKFAIIGYARSAYTNESFRAIFAASIKTHHKEMWNEYQEEQLKNLLDHVFYFRGQYDSADDIAGYGKFRDETMDGNIDQELVYFSVPPSVFEPVIDGLAKIKTSTHTTKLIIEKPFGHNAESARQLKDFLDARFEHKEVYLLDHYLGKKPVRSILALRKANRVLNLVLQPEHIANIQISALETVDVNERIGYFDQAGIIQDMIQSHLLQVLSLCTLSLPDEYTAESTQKARYDVLKNVHFANEKSHVITGQYAGYPVAGSNTETFCAVRLKLCSPHWHDVPVYIRTGKALHKKHTYVSIELKLLPGQDPKDEPNRVIFEFSPNEQIKILLLDKDHAMDAMRDISTSDSLACHGDYCLPEHGLMLLDILKNDHMHFLSADEIIACWDAIDCVNDTIKKHSIAPIEYPFGGSGPHEHAEIMVGTKDFWFEYSPEVHPKS